MKISAGWVRNADFPQPERYDFPSTDAYVNVPSTFVSHINGLRFPGQQTKIIIFQDVNVSCCLFLSFSRLLYYGPERSQKPEVITTVKLRQQLRSSGRNYFTRKTRVTAAET